MKGEQDPTEPDQPDARTVARQHTASILKMLRGYGPAPGSATTPAADRRVVAEVESSPPIVADSNGTYLCSPEVPPRPPAARFGAGSVLTAPIRQHRADRLVPTVGDALRHQPGILGKLMAQAAKLAQTNRIFQGYLPLHLHRHTTLLQLDPEAWTVQTESASWATRLRYALHENRQALGDELGFLPPKPRILVVPVAVPIPLRRPRLTLTAENAQQLEAAARTILDPRLSAALRRLAKHADRNPAPPG